MTWRDRYSLSTQFLSAAAVVLLLSMIVLGTWVTHQITRSVLATSGADAAAFMRGVLQEYVQRIAADGSLHPDDAAALDGIFVGTPLGESIVSVKIWTVDAAANATIHYSSLADEVIGEQHVSTDVLTAASGQIVAEFEDMISAESHHEQQLAMPLIEVYAPLYRSGTNELLAVGEVYEDATILARQLRESVVRTWLIVCATTLATLGILYLIVRRGSVLIRQQQSELSRKVSEAQDMATQNYALRLEADRSRLDANEANEELLGRIGLEIHDGPIQLLTLIRLRVDRVLKRMRDAELLGIGDRLAQVIDELRDISVGLVLPELHGLSVQDTIALAIERHEHMTGTSVEFRGDGLSDAFPDALKICVYRIVQESLSNAFKHAGGHDQRVSATVTGGELHLTISDGGLAAGVVPSGRSSGATKLGRRGIANRVAAFGGSLDIASLDRSGTRVSVSIPVSRGSWYERRLS